MINKFTKKVLFSIAVFTFILFNISLAKADWTTNVKNLGDNLINNLLSNIVNSLITLAFLVFIYGIFIFIYNRITKPGNAQELKKGQDFMIWGLGALVVIVSVWGIIRFAQVFFGVSDTSINNTTYFKVSD